MSKSGVAPQVIGVPKGGGAIQGIGETFSPDLFTGTANLTVPIALPNGRNGFQPKLELLYTSGGGNGPFGLGFSSNIPGVARKTSRGIPRYDDDEDTFVLSAGEDLVLVESSARERRYRPRIEGTFASIVHHKDGDGDRWVVSDKSGSTSIYGRVRGVPSSENAFIADPHRADHIFQWKLSETSDPHGNRILYEYEREANQVRRNFDEIRLSRIRYVDTRAQDGSTHWLVSVRFLYDDRPDPFSSYRAGFEIRSTKRCTSIEIWTHAGVDRLARSYDLIYLDQRNDPLDGNARLPGNGVSLLSRIRVRGGAEDDPRPPRTRELPPLDFEYSAIDFGERRLLNIEGPDLPIGSLANPNMELASLFGNGLPDVVEIGEGITYWRNLGGARFDRPRTMEFAPTDVSLADPRVQLMDVDGDGRIDLVAERDGLSGYYPLDSSGSWTTFHRFDRAPSVAFSDPEVRLIDLDGDGVTDAMRSGAELECFYQDQSEGWTTAERSSRAPPLSFSDPRVKLADMTGDGLQDIVLVHDGNVEYWPNLGFGRFGDRISMGSAPHFPRNHDPRRLLLGDIDGDGVADLVYAGDGFVNVWLNQSGNSFGRLIQIEGTPFVTHIDAVRIVDLLGSGVAGLLYTGDGSHPGRSRHFFLDFAGGKKPYLLDKLTNHLGAETRVEYRSSVEYFLEDQKNPHTRWETLLPFPVHVVAAVESRDELSGNIHTKTFSYHHGHWDGAEREFRGFARVDTRDVRRPSGATNAGNTPSPPAERRTWFHVGPVGPEHGAWRELDLRSEYWSGDPNLFQRTTELVRELARFPRRIRRDAIRSLKGRELRTELYAPDHSTNHDRPYTVIERQHAFSRVVEPAASSAIFFCYEARERTTQWERGDDPLTKLAFMDEYDPNGQLVLRIEIACPRGWRAIDDVPGVPFLATRTRMVYGAPASNAARSIRDRLVRTSAWGLRNDGNLRATDLLLIGDDGPSAEILSDVLQYYDGDAFVGLPYGVVGDFGALVRTEKLILTDEILQARGDPIQPFLDPQGPPAWSYEYPAAFRQACPPLAGYSFEAGAAGAVRRRGYYATTERRQYDFQNPAVISSQGAVVAFRDPLGRESTIAHDSYGVFPVRVASSIGLEVSAEYDYRAFATRLITDENGNRTAATYTGLGLLESVARMGKVGEDVGDTLDRPSVVYDYDLLAFFARAEPISVRTTRRNYHAHDLDIPHPNLIDQTVTSVEFSDGFGRLLQTRLQAGDQLFGDPIFAGSALPADQDAGRETAADLVGRTRRERAPVNVVVSGAARYDEKGRLIEKYEPYFDTDWSYAAPGPAQQGQRVSREYDARGELIRTIFPDGSETRLVRGIPHSIDDPSSFRPTLWETFIYDANDLAPILGLANRAMVSHHFTPASIVLDALGRVVESTQRNGVDPRAWSTTRTRYDLRGNIVSVEDALGRLAARSVYDLESRVIRTDTLDGGSRRAVLDASGSELESRDDKGSLVLHVYDLRGRRTLLYARDRLVDEVTLRERLEYGDASDPAQPAVERAARRALNLLGAPSRQHDEAGLLTFEAYDFKSNVREKVRRVILLDRIQDLFAGHRAGDWDVERFSINWEPVPGMTLAELEQRLLDPREYRTSITYDAQNRVERLRYPRNTDGVRSELVPEHDPAGNIERLTLDGQAYVTRIARDAGGRRTLILLGNGLMTRHAYDPETCRLTRLRSERFEELAQGDAPLVRPRGQVVQDFGYEYDLAGNLLRLRDRAPRSGLNPAPDRLDRLFDHDALYRLVRSTGREADRPHAPEPWTELAAHNDPNATRAYVEEYRYNAAGSLIGLAHRDDGGGFLRDLTPEPGSNRLSSLNAGQLAVVFEHDRNGNVTREGGARYFDWDHANRLRVYRTQTDAGAEPSVHAHYFYDASGERTQKIARRQGGLYEVTIYVDGIFEHRRLLRPARQEIANTITYVMDEGQRICSVRSGVPFPEDRTPAVKYELGDHLASSHVVVDEAGAEIAREEYTAYGETSFGGYASKRYRLSGKERDEESGLYHQGARPYAPWLARWMTTDPQGPKEGLLNAYRYVAGRPLSLRDPNGTSGQPGPDSGDAFDPAEVVRRIDARVANARSSIPAGATEQIHENVFTEGEIAGGLVLGLAGPWVGAGLLFVADSAICTTILRAPKLFDFLYQMAAGLAEAPTYVPAGAFAAAGGVTVAGAVVGEVGQEVERVRGNFFSQLLDTLASDGLELALGVNRAPGAAKGIVQRWAAKLGLKTYWHFFEDTDDLRLLAGRLLDLMDKATKIHFNLDHLVPEGYTLKEILELGQRGIGQGNVTRWELDQVLKFFKDKAVFYLEGQERNIDELLENWKG